MYANAVTLITASNIVCGTIGYTKRVFNGMISGGGIDDAMRYQIDKYFMTPNGPEGSEFDYLVMNALEVYFGVITDVSVVREPNRS